MTGNEIVCRILTISGNQITLIARSTAKLFCYYRLKSWAKAVFLGKPDVAITAIASELGDAGASIDAATALNAINTEVEKIIPQLTVLKNSTDVALTEITEVHTINRISLSIGVDITNNNELGPVKIDGIGFRIQATEE
jgi:hypothetical protein